MSTSGSSGSGRTADRSLVVMSGSPLSWPGSGALVEGLPLLRGGSDVDGGGAVQPVLRALLHDVRRPARDARADEDRREQVGRYVEEVIHGRGVEIRVREQPLLVPRELL